MDIEIEQKKDYLWSDTTIDAETEKNADLCGPVKGQNTQYKLIFFEFNIL